MHTPGVGVQVCTSCRAKFAANRQRCPRCHHEPTVTTHSPRPQVAWKVWGPPGLIIVCLVVGVAIHAMRAADPQPQTAVPRGVGTGRSPLAAVAARATASGSVTRQPAVSTAAAQTAVDEYQAAVRRS